MELRKREESRKAPALAALTLVGAGAGARALMKRDKIIGAIGRGNGSNGAAAGSPDGGADGDLQPVTRLPKPGIG